MIVTKIRRFWVHVVLIGPLFLGLILGGFAGPNVAYACSCRAYASTEEAFRQASKVFAGTVESLKRFDIQSQTSVRARMTLRKVWKGENVGDSIYVLTASSTAACGFPFEEGSAYLIFAFDVGEDVSTTICSGSKPLGQAGAEIMDLNELLERAQANQD